MLIIDAILLAVIAIFVFYGLFFGLIRSVGALLGFLAGIWVAVSFSGMATAWVKNLFFGYDSLGRVLTFLVLFIIANRLVAFAFAMLDRAFDLISIIPFLKTINRLAGAVFGLLLGGLIAGLGLYALLTVPFLGGWVAEPLSRSQVAPYLLRFIVTMQPILPRLIIQLKSFI